MPSILENLKPELKAELAERRTPPCREDELRLYKALAADIDLRPTYVPPPTSPSGCTGNYKLSGLELLSGAMVDEPDGTFDIELPESSDPEKDRKWMGGLKGIGSQGFRHMYFGGWSILHPIASMQFPWGAMGQAPERAQLIGDRARKELRGGSKLWGYRLLAWSTHYIQDLTQPFHAAQIPNVFMVPWSKLFNGFIPETTRTISNYHWAYEGFALHELSNKPKGRLADCLARPANHTTLPTSLAAYSPDEFPRDLALTVAKASQALAADIGSALMKCFGRELKKPGYDLAHTENPLDYTSLETRPESKDAYEALLLASCPALANASVATTLLIEWAHSPISQAPAPEK